MGQDVCWDGGEDAVTSSGILRGGRPGNPVPIQGKRAVGVLRAAASSGQMAAFRLIQLGQSHPIAWRWIFRVRRV